jgi:hypothetical protein
MITTPDPIAALVGRTSEWRDASNLVEASEVRRFLHAILEETSPVADGRVAAWHPAPIAPLGFAMHAFRRPLGTPDPLVIEPEAAWGGLGELLRIGLPRPEGAFTTVINAAYDFEAFRYVHLGERLRIQSRYEDVWATTHRDGPALVVAITDFVADATGQPVAKVRNSLLIR